MPARQHLTRKFNGASQPSRRHRALRGPSGARQAAAARALEDGKEWLQRCHEDHRQALAGSRHTHEGKAFHVHSSIDPRHCAIMLALFERKGRLDFENEPSYEELLEMGEQKWKEDQVKQRRAHVVWMASARAAVAKL